MKKAIVLFLFAIATTVASFAQSYTPVAVEDPIYTGVIGRWQFDPDGWGSDWEAEILVTPNEGSYASMEIIDYLGKKAVIATLNLSNCDTDFDCHVRPVGGGWSSYVSITVKAYPPSTPSHPLGPGDTGVNDTESYSTSANGAHHYVWSITGGSYSIIGPDDEDDIDIKFLTGGVTYQVKVAAIKCTTTSNWSTIKYVEVFD